jgi:hypothetical protein
MLRERCCANDAARTASSARQQPIEQDPAVVDSCIRSKIVSLFSSVVSVALTGGVTTERRDAMDRVVRRS